MFAEAKKDDNIRKFTSNLDCLVQSIHQSIIEIKSRVQNPMLLNGDTLAVVALEKISDMTEEVTKLSNKARSYASYQERFGSSLANTRRNYNE